MKDSLIKVFKSWEFDTEVIGAKIIIAAFVLLICFVAGRLSKKIFLKINAKLTNNHPDVFILLSKLIYYIFLFLGYFLFLKILGLEQYFSKLLAGAGIIGIIAGFALKDIASNAFSGLLLFVKKPFQKDDWVQLDGHYGRVKLVGWLTTTLANRTGQEVYVSNQLIYSGTFINYSKNNRRRICLQAEVKNFHDLPKLKALLEQKVSNSNVLIKKSSVDFYVTSLSVNGDFSFEILYWINFDEGDRFRETISNSVLGIQEVGLSNNITIENIVWVSDEEDGTSAERFGING